MSAQVFRKQYLFLGLVAVLAIATFISFMLSSPEAVVADTSSGVFAERGVPVLATQSVPSEAGNVAPDAHPADCSHCNTANTGEEVIPRLLATRPDLDYIFKGIAKQEDVTAPRSAFGLKGSQKGHYVSLSIADLELSGTVTAVLEDPNASAYAIKLDNNIGRLVVNVDGNDSFSGQVLFFGDSRALIIRDHPDQSDIPKLIVEETKISDLYCAPKDTIYTETGLQSIKNAGNKDPLAKAYAPFAGIAEAIPLDSLPGAEFVMYLDFDGEEVTDPNWTIDGVSIDALPHPKANDDSFVTSVWQRVAEDFAPFNITVTTDVVIYDAADSDKRLHVVITPTDDAAPGVGGVAYLFSFRNASPVVWVFNLSEYTCATTISHEAGHAFGLYHDGQPDVEYYPGHNGSYTPGWAPIMGAAFSGGGLYDEVDQWSKGEYDLANNQEDDLLIIGGNRNGFGFKEDDYSDSIIGDLSADVGALSPIGVDLIGASGLISRSTDIDVFRFASTDGDISLTVSPLDVDSSDSQPGSSTQGANLAVQANLLDSNGLLITAGIPDSPALLDSTLTATLSAGIYYISVEGAGRGADPASGFSDYASLGKYSIELALPIPPLSVTGGEGGYKHENPIVQGDVNTQASNGTDFGFSYEANVPVIHTFHLANTETSPITNLSVELVSGDHFYITKSPNASIGGNVTNYTLSIAYDPNSRGPHTDTVIISYEAGESVEYRFAISGTSTISGSRDNYWKNNLRGDTDGGTAPANLKQVQNTWLSDYMGLAFFKSSRSDWFSIDAHADGLTTIDKLITVEVAYDSSEGPVLFELWSYYNDFYGSTTAEDGIIQFRLPGDYNTKQSRLYISASSINGSAVNTAYDLRWSSIALTEGYDDLYEENDSLETAFDLTGAFSSRFSEYLGEGISNDEDWYKIEIPRDPFTRMLYVRADFVHAEGNIDIEVLDENGSSITSETVNDYEVITFHQTVSMDGFDENFNVSNALVMGVEPGTYYVRVHGDFAGNSYDLVVEARTDDRYEVVDQDEQRNDIENDRLDDAFDLGGTIIDNWLSEVDGIGTCAAYPENATQEFFRFDSDDDWFEFSANSDTDLNEITIEYMSIDGGFMVFEIIDSDGVSLALSTVVNGTTTAAFLSGALSITDPSDTTYFIKVTPFVTSSVLNRSSALSGYDFRVTLTSEPSMIDGAVEDNYEENDNFQELFDLRDYAGFWLAAVDGLGTQLDPDWYEISVPAGAGQLSLTLISDSSVGNVDLTLSKKDGPKVFESLGGGNTEAIIWNDPTPGAYALTVSGDSLGNSYNLFWDVVLEDDSYEENDERLSATDLSNSDRTWLRKVRGPGVQRDEDWYKINVPSNTEILDIRTNFNPDAGDIDLELYNASGYLIARSVSNDAIESLILDSPASGDYYIQIHYGNAGNEYDLWWAAFTQLELSSVAEDVYEPNNTAGAATILDNDHSWLSDLLGVATQTDDDWFEITLAEGNIGLDVDLTFTHADGDIDVEVYDALGSVITRSESLTDNESINYNAPLPAGNYQIRVYGANVANEYDLYWVDRNRDVFESNNTRQTAYDLRNDKQFYISQIGVPTQGNDDWYQIETLVDNSTIVVDLTYSHLNGDINLELYDSSGSLITNSTTTEDFEYIQQEVLATGIYYVRVWGDDNYGDYDLFWNAQLEDAFEENDAFLPQEDIPNIGSAGSNAVAFDDDWFAITPPLGALSVQVDLAFTHGVGNLDLEAYDAINGNLNLIDSSVSADDNETLTIPVEPFGLPFYVRVFHPDRDYGNTYSLTWINTTTDAYEGNNSIENAFDLTATEGDFLSDGAGFATSKSEDWYRVDVTGLNFAVYCSFTHADGDIDIELFDANGNFVDRSISDSDDEFILQEGIASGTYYLKVFGELKGNLYDLIWNTYGTDADDVFEENDSSVTASDLTATEYEIVSDLVLLDEDWFQVEVENPGDRLIVECDFGGVGGTLELMDLPSTVDSGRDLVRIDRSGLGVGSYLVRITGQSVATPYTLRWSSGADDSYEPNDSLAENYSMNPGALLPGNQYDEDWYSVEVLTAGNSLGAFFSFTATEGDLSLKIFDSLGAELTQSASTVEDDTSIFSDGLSAGTYYIQVDGPNMGTEYNLVWIEILDDNYEENDALVDAYDLSSAEGVDLSSISGDGVQIDEDWYLVSLPSNPTDSNGDPADPAEILNVELTYTHTNGDINFEVRDSSGVNMLASSNSLTDTESVSLYVADGNDYYIVVTGDNARNSYDLGWSLSRGDYYEENDTLADAYDLSSAEGVDLSSISGLGVQLDEDWYEIITPPGSVGVEVTLSGNTDLEVFDSSSASVAVTPVTGSVDTIRFPTDLLGATYYLRVYGDDAGNAYDLRWESTTEDAYEPNDDLASAADISAEQGMLLSESSGFGTQFDEDWYLVSLPSNPTDSNGDPVGPAGVLNVELTYTHAPSPTWEVYDNFSANTIDTQKWDFSYWDGGNSPTLSNGRALLSGNTVSNWDATQVTQAMLQANGNAANLVSGGEAHSILEFKDSDSILGIEMELTLPVGVSDNVGIGLYAIDYDVMFNSPNQDPVIFDLDLWNSSGSSSPEVQITWKDPVSGTEQEANGVPVAAGQTVLLKFERTEDTIRFFVDNTQVAESGYSSGNETFMIRAVSEDGDSFLSYVDNVRVLRDTTSTIAGDINFEVRGSTGVNVLASSNLSTGTESASVDVDDGNDYYIVVTGDNSGNSYDLVWSLIRDDDYEENDNITFAYDLSSAEGVDLSSISGLGVQLDEDWYEIITPPGSVGVEVTLSGNTDLEVFDSSSPSVAVTPVTGSVDTIRFPTDPLGATYYLRVYGDDAGNAYDLRWESTTEDAYEPNNFVEDAYDLSSYEGVDLSSISGFGTQFDEDWYKIVTTPGSVGVEVTLTGNTDLEVFDSSSTSLAVAGVTVGTGTIRFPTDPLGATYYLRVYGDDAGNAYDLRWESTTEDAYEENNDLDSAADISTEQGMLLSESSGFGTQFDEDWYLVSLPSNPTDSNGNPVGPAEILNVELTYTHALPPTWELYDKFNGSAIDPQKWDFAYWDGGNLPTPSIGRALLSGNTVSNWDATRVTEAMLQANGNAANLVSGGQAHSILEFKDSDSILGIEMELTLPVGVSDNVGIGLYAIDYDVMFNSPNQDPVIFDLDLWNSSGSSSPEVQITWKDPVSGTEQEANGVPVAPGQTVLLKFERTEDTIRFFVDNTQVAESGYSSGNETFMIRAVSEDGDSFLAYVDNVRVMRDTASGIAGDINFEVRDSSGVELTHTSAPTWELYDNFSGSTIDTQKWETTYWPGGLSPLISNGQLKLENGGGSGRKDAAFMSTLQSAGFDLLSATDHSGVAFTDPSIIGIEADLFLPAGVASDSGVFIELFEQVSPQEIRAAGVELGYWGGNQAELWFHKSAYSNGIETSEVDQTELVTLGQSYRVRMLRQDGLIKLYRDDVLVQTHAAEGELLAMIIHAFNDLGQSMYATVDNVRVLRENVSASSNLSTGTESASVDVDDGNDYYIVVTGDNTGDPYDLVWSVVREDNYEQNDTQADAYDLSSGEGVDLSSISGSGTQFDEDWYKIVTTPGSVGVEVTLTGNTDLEVFDSSSTSLAVAGVTVGTGTIRFPTDPLGATYYFQVTGDDTGESYDLMWSSSTVDAYELNNFVEDAKILFSYEGLYLDQIDGHATQFDDDWYAVVVSERSSFLIIRCQFTHADGDIDLELYQLVSSPIDERDSFSVDERKPKLLRRSTNSNNAELIFLPNPEPGIYFIRAYFGNTGNAYRLFWDDGVDDAASDADYIDDYLNENWVYAPSDNRALLDSPSANEDGDSFTNWEEYALGLDPSVQDYVVVGQSITEIAGKNYFQFEFLRRKEAVVLGYEFIVEESSNMAFNGSTAVLVGAEDVNSEIERVFYRGSLPMDEQSQCFFRLVVNEPISK